MSGKINGTSSGSQPQQVGAGSASPAARNVSGITNAVASAATGSKGAANAGTDQVDITGTASELATAEQSLSSVPVVNDAKVNTIRSAIEGGTYRIQPQKIASKLVEFERDLPETADSDSSDAA